ncbi:hypothetical protein CJO85_01165 [Ralstonia solanacearum]|nr:hypothetical protein CJO85_01165 [Ralstonia solanacearum]
MAVRCCPDGLSVTDIAGKFARSIRTLRSQKRSAFRRLRHPHRGPGTSWNGTRASSCRLPSAKRRATAAAGQNDGGGARPPAIPVRARSHPDGARRRRAPCTHRVRPGVGPMRCAARAAGGFPAA